MCHYCDTFDLKGKKCPVCGTIKKKYVDSIPRRWIPIEENKSMPSRPTWYYDHPPACTCVDCETKRLRKHQEIEEEVRYSKINTSNKKNIIEAKGKNQTESDYKIQTSSIKEENKTIEQKQSLRINLKVFILIVIIIIFLYYLYILMIGKDIMIPFINYRIIGFH